jgi:hypothetical protein
MYAVATTLLVLIVYLQCLSYVLKSENPGVFSSGVLRML